MDTSVPFAVPGEGVGHRVTPDHEKDKGRAGSQQHHEPGEADPTSRVHMTGALRSTPPPGWRAFKSGLGWFEPGSWTSLPMPYALGGNTH